MGRAAKVLLCPLMITFVGCGHAQEPNSAQQIPSTIERIEVGAEQMALYLPMLKDKRVAVVSNQTGMVNQVHLVDTLISSGVDVRTVFCPEHGFRGTADAGAQVADSKDKRTGLPLISLYGKNKKPSKEQIADVDVILFDIQDVGVRFYTYISTMHYCMEAAAENGKSMIVLDRPNPNGYYVDGPVLEEEHASFVGMHPIPIVHGLTVGELAQMINGEEWLENEITCDLTVIPCANYTHDSSYALPVRPSPNLPNSASIQLYPSLGLFEGTVLSVGRGTDAPFQCIGHPDLSIGNFRFTPKSGPGSKYPPHEDLECRGFKLSTFGSFHFKESKALNLLWLIDTHKDLAPKGDFFNSFFTKLAGTRKLQQQIESGMSGDDIRDSWKADLKVYLQLRSKYLLYK